MKGKDGRCAPGHFGAPMWSYARADSGGHRRGPMALGHRSACQAKVNDARSSKLTVLRVTGHVLASSNRSNQGVTLP